ncbi:hypothetical protein GW17_00000750 [Ensete ventricosum]|nr:hypothetical protein GW17_00000750 [Ensete ventricosum]
MQANGVNAAPATDCGVPAPSDAKGKHRISAELKRLEQEARFLEVKPSFSRPPLSLNSLVKEKSPERKINLLFTSFQSDFEEIAELEKIEKVSASLHEYDLQAHLGTAGSKDLKICQAADAGYSGSN